MNNNIADFFPTLQENAAEFYAVMEFIAVAMTVGGLITSIYRARLNSVDYINSIVAVGLVGLAIGNFPEWSNLLQDIAQEVLETLNADPSKSHENFARYVAGVSADSDQSAGFFDVVFAKNGGIGQAILYMIVLLLAKTASAIMWLIFVLQQLLVQFQIGLAPVFLAMFLIGPLRSVAVKFVMSFIALLIWPIGWGIASLMTDAILELAADNPAASVPRIQQISDSISFGLSSTQIFFFTLVLSIWILISSIAAPFIINKLLNTGANAGAILLSNVGLGASQAALYGVSGGVTATMAGASPAVSASTAVASGVGGVVSGSQGSNGVTIPSAIGVAAALAVSNSAGGAQADPIAKAHNLANQARKS